MATKQAKSSKAGRNAQSCQAYKASNRRLKNKLVTLKKRVARHPNDVVAFSKLKEVNALLHGSTRPNG